MASSKIKEITIEMGRNTTKLGKSLEKQDLLTQSKLVFMRSNRYLRRW